MPGRFLGTTPSEKVTPDRRIAVAAALGAIVSAPQLTSPFTLCARTPFIAGRGRLSVSRALSVDTNTAPFGKVRLVTTRESVPTIELVLENVDGRRVLVDCEFEGLSATQLVASGSNWDQTLSFNGQLGTFVTPVLGPRDEMIRLEWAERLSPTPPGDHYFVRADFTLIDPAK